MIDLAVLAVYKTTVLPLETLFNLIGMIRISYRGGIRPSGDFLKPRIYKSSSKRAKLIMNTRERGRDNDSTLMITARR